MNIFTVLLLAVVQGFAELLPVSSSAHVIVVEKLLGIDPTTPAMTFLLVMLHSGTMLACLLYFWKRWSWLLSKNNPRRGTFVGMLALATGLTGLLGLGLQWIIEKLVLGGAKGAAVEDLFGNLDLVAGALAVAGVLILGTGLARRKDEFSEEPTGNHSLLSAAAMGMIQGLSLPFRGLSRSGTTISVGLLTGMSRRFAEEFSFFLAVILTFPVVGREFFRLKDASTTVPGDGLPWLMGIVGLVFSFGAGYAAIRWLSSWLESGRWGWFGIYCLAAAGVIMELKMFGLIS